MGVMTIFYYLIGLSLLLLVGRIFLLPMKRIFKLIGNGIMGGLTLVIFNLIGGIFGLGIVINPLNALIVGFFGVPGVILLLIFENFL